MSEWTLERAREFRGRHPDCDFGEFPKTEVGRDYFNYVVELCIYDLPRAIQLADGRDYLAFVAGENAGNMENLAAAEHNWEFLEWVAANCGGDDVAEEVRRALALSAGDCWDDVAGEARIALEAARQAARDAAEKPLILERARAFVVFSGRYEGRKIGNVAATEDGREFLEWVAENWEGDFGRAAKVVLDSIRPTSAQEIHRC